jgi:predicted dehydrogenase
MHVGVLGLGSIGMRHARNLIALGARVTGFDPDQARRRMLEQAGAVTTTERDTLLEVVEAVVVASPSHHHFDDLRDSIGHGRHTFVEKPLAHRTTGIDEQLMAAANRGLVVFAGFNLRYHPVVAEAKRVLDSGRLGKPLWARFVASSYLPDWRPGADYRRGYTADARTGGVLFDDIHEFDLANYLLGPADVAACVARNTGELEIDAEDSADVILRHASGVQSALHVDYASLLRQRSSEINCQRGALRLELIARELREVAPDGTVGVATMPGSVSDDYIAEMQDFIDCAATRRRPRCTGQEALEILRQVIDARAAAGLPQ